MSRHNPNPWEGVQDSHRLLQPEPWEDDAEALAVVEAAHGRRAALWRSRSDGKRPHEMGHRD